MRICREKATGKLIEMQSHATAGTLIQNAVNAGYAISDIEEMEVTEQEYQALVANQPKTADEIKANLVKFVQSLLDGEAIKHNYDNIVSATSYAGYPNQFQAEGIAFGVWRSAVWAKCYEIMADVLEGRRQVPTEAELIVELPKLTL